MREVSYKEIKPFVRYARYLDKDMYLHLHEMKGCDARLLYCCEGAGMVYVDGVEYEIKEGTLLVFKSGVRYKYVLENVKNLRFIALNFDFLYDNSTQTTPIPPKKLEDFDEESILQDIYFTDCPVFNKPVVLHNANMFHQRLAEIEREFVTKSLFYELRISGMLSQILGETAVFNLYASAKEHKTVKAVSEYIRQNLEKELSNKYIGKIFGYHPNYINQLFVRSTGMSLHKYLAQTRISKAMELLQNTNMSVNEICTKCGFSDLPHFSKAFKKSTGYPPSGFRLL